MQRIAPPPHPEPGQLQQATPRSVRSGHSGQELKCSEEEPGSVSTASPRAHSARRRRPARPEPRGQQRRSRCREPSRASVARPLTKFARGPRRAGHPAEELSWRRSRRHRRRHRGLRVSGEERTEQPVRVTPGRCCSGSAVPAPGAAGQGEEAEDNKARLFYRSEAPLRSEPKGKATLPFGQQP